MNLSEFENRATPEPNTGCLLWTGASQTKGYGMVCIGTDDLWLTHRLAWTLANGPIPKGLCVLHKCDTRSCINIDHLFLGTISENQSDAAKKGRMPRGEGHFNAKLQVAEVLRIRERLSAGETCRNIAADLGIHQGTISRIKRRTLWGWLQ